MACRPAVYAGHIAGDVRDQRHRRAVRKVLKQQRPDGRDDRRLVKAWPAPGMAFLRMLQHIMLFSRGIGISLPLPLLVCVCVCSFVCPYLNSTTNHARPIKLGSLSRCLDQTSRRYASETKGHKVTKSQNQFWSLISAGVGLHLG